METSCPYNIDSPLASPKDLDLVMGTTTRNRNHIFPAIELYDNIIILVDKG